MVENNLPLNSDSASLIKIFSIKNKYVSLLEKQIEFM